MQGRSISVGTQAQRAVLAIVLVAATVTLAPQPAEAGTSPCVATAYTPYTTGASG